VALSGGLRARTFGAVRRCLPGLHRHHDAVSFWRPWRTLWGVWSYIPPDVSGWEHSTEVVPMGAVVGCVNDCGLTGGLGGRAVLLGGERSGGRDGQSAAVVLTDIGGRDLHPRPCIHPRHHR
jgi:hypothetical protein